MKRLIENMAFGPPIAVIVLFVLDIFLWQSHPMALVVGAAAAHMLDPLVIAVSLAVGLAMKPDWRPVLAALAIGAAAEMLNMNNLLRQYEGTTGFNIATWLTRSVASCTIIAVAAAMRMGWEALMREPAR